MTEQPPPPSADNIMQAQGQLPQMISVPLNVIKTIAEAYTQHRGVIRGVVGALGHKIPKEAEDFLAGIVEDNPEKVRGIIEGTQRMATGQQQNPYSMNPNADPYNVDQVEIPPPVIGQRVLTQDIAQQAWTLHYQHHWTFRQIAEYLTQEGYPVSHTTVSNYISEIDEDIAEEQSSKGRRLKRGFLTAAMLIVPSLATFLVVHFLRL
jgi:hypothetical protein